MYIRLTFDDGALNQSTSFLVCLLYGRFIDMHANLTDLTLKSLL